MEKLEKDLKEFPEGFNMMEIVHKARAQQRQGGRNDQQLSHVAEWRCKSERQKWITKLELLWNFKELRERIKNEMMKVCVHPDDARSDLKLVYIGLNNFCQ